MFSDIQHLVAMRHQFSSLEFCSKDDFFGFYQCYNSNGCLELVADFDSGLVLVDAPAEKIKNAAVAKSLCLNPVEQPQDGPSNGICKNEQFCAKPIAPDAAVPPAAKCKDPTGCPHAVPKTASPGV